MSEQTQRQARALSTEQVRKIELPHTGRIDRDDPLDWYIEVCAICGCQLGPGIGSRTRTGRCVVEQHHQAGGVIVRVVARAEPSIPPLRGGP